MKALVAVIAALGSMALLNGCGQREETAEAPPTATTQEQPGMDSASDVSPVNAQTWLDDFTIGSEVGPDGTVPAEATGDDFTPGDPIHLVMEVGDAPEGAAVKVVWYGPNDTPMDEETKTVSSGEKHLAFTADDTKSWQKGDYRAEVWVGDEKVNQQMFNMVEARSASN